MNELLNLVKNQCRNLKKSKDVKFLYSAVARERLLPSIYIKTGQTAQVVRRSLLVREVWGSNPKPIKSPTRCQQLGTLGDRVDSEIEAINFLVFRSSSSCYFVFLCFCTM